MRNVKGFLVIVFNLFVLLMYSMTTGGGRNSLDFVFGMAIKVSIHGLICLIVSLYLLCREEERHLGLGFVISCLLIWLIGFSTCTGTIPFK